MIPNWISRVFGSKDKPLPAGYAYMVDQLTKLLTGGLTFRDNFNSATIGLTLTSGTPVTITSPLKNKGTVLAVWPLDTAGYIVKLGVKADGQQVTITPSIEDTPLHNYTSPVATTLLVVGG